MFSIFSTREIAWGLWIIIFIVYAFIAKSIRNSILDVIKIACSKQLIIFFFIVITYATILTYLFSRTAIWNYKFIKDITIWVLFVGMPICFNAIVKNIGISYFENIIVNNLKLTTIAEFFLSSFTFNILVEIILVPILTFILLLDTVADTKKEYESVKKLLSWLLSFLGFLILGFTLKHAISEYVSFLVIDSLISFILPLILSILYIPIAYAFAIYAKYESVFLRMSFNEPNDKKIRRKHQWKVFKTCALSYSKILRFEQDVVKNMYQAMDNNEFNSLIKNFETSERIMHLK